MKQVLKEFIGNIHIKTATHYRSLSVFPVLLSSDKTEGDSPFQLVQNSLLGKDNLYLYEPPKTMKQWWELLYSQNYNKEPVFLPEGLLLEGGRQNRIISRSYLIPKKKFFRKTYEVSTFCIERLRSSGKRMDHFKIRGFAPVHIRALGGDTTPHKPQKQKQVWDSVSNSLTMTGIGLASLPTMQEGSSRQKSSPSSPSPSQRDLPPGGQTSFISLHDIQNSLLAMQANRDIEEEVSSKEGGKKKKPSGVENSSHDNRFSRTEDLTDIFKDETNAKLIAQALSHFQVLENQIGSIAVLPEGDKKYAFLDLFGSPHIFRAFHEDLFSSYIITEQVFRRKNPTTSEKPLPDDLEIAQRVLSSLHGEDREVNRDSTLGENFRVIGKDFEATGHIYEDSLLSLRASNYQVSYRELSLKQGVTLVGRQLRRDVQNPNAQLFQIEDPLISRHHGKFEFNGNKCTYRDLKSTNGSEVLKEGEFEKISSSVKIADGSLLRLGDTFLKVQFNGSK